MYQKPVIAAFVQKGWTTILLNRLSDDPNDHYSACYQQAKAAIVWTKLIPTYSNQSQTWQRHSQLPFEMQMSKKDTTTQYLRDYAKREGRVLPFIPESYVLPDDRLEVLERLSEQGSDGNEPWVVKLSGVDVSGHLGKGCIDTGQF